MEEVRRQTSRPAEDCLLLEGGFADKKMTGELLVKGKVICPSILGYDLDPKVRGQKQ